MPSVYKDFDYFKDCAESSDPQYMYVRPLTEKVIMTISCFKEDGICLPEVVPGKYRIFARYQEGKIRIESSILSSHEMQIQILHGN